MSFTKRFAVLVLAVLLSFCFVITVSATEPTEATEPTVSNNSNYVARPDYTELTRQIAIAEGLKKSDYTAESWAVLEEALADAQKTLKHYWQKTIDNAAKTLEDAIADLVKMDYSSLWAVLMEVGELDKPEEVYDVWTDLVLAVEKGKDLLSSGDQEAVDLVTIEISEALVRVKQYLEEASKPQIVVKEVEVEVPPAGEFCNIAIHQIWPVAFAVSAILNLALVIVIVSILRKKNKQKDDTPLIDYDIDDDFEM